jgi:hypothetical protein
VVSYATIVFAIEFFLDKQADQGKMLVMSDTFVSLLGTLTNWLASRPLEPNLVEGLNAEFPADGELFKHLAQECAEGLRSGRFGRNGDQRRRWGRVFEPNSTTAGFSVDVVFLDETSGPPHRHPNGEIDMIIPLDPEARFDGQGRGWLVYGPGSVHTPLATRGRLLVLYLLPNGSIEFLSSQSRPENVPDQASIKALAS